MKTFHLKDIQLFKKSILLLFLIIGSNIFAQSTDSTKTKQKNISIIGLPAFFYQPETSFGFGAVGLMYFKTNKNDTTLRTSNIQLSAVYTLKKQILSSLISNFFFDQNNYEINSEFVFFKYPNKFYGTGNDITMDYEDYSYNVLKIRFKAFRQIAYNFYGGIEYQYRLHEMISSKEGGILDSGIEGGQGRHKVSGIGLNLKYDNRDNAMYPGSGNFNNLSFVKYGQKLGGTKSFTRLSVDLRKYITVNKRLEHIVAVQLKYDGIIEGTAPFYYVPRLGGAYLLRGFFEGKYRDDHLMLAQLEYRFPLFWKRRVRMTVFGATGLVADEFENFEAKNILPAAGAGIRFKILKDRDAYLRIDAGFGKKTNGIYLNFSEAF